MGIIIYRSQLRSMFPDVVFEIHMRTYLEIELIKNRNNREEA